MVGKTRSRISSFSVLLVIVALSMLGIFSIGYLNVQYNPPVQKHSITVSFSYPNADPEVVESEVTSKIEGVLSNIKGVSEVSSNSSNGSGNVSISFKKETNISAARFEVASKIRNLYPYLPKNVSYPYISLNSHGQQAHTALVFELKGAMPSQEIERFARERILPNLATIAGVDAVNLSGATPYELVISFDEHKAKEVNIQASDIVTAFNNYYKSQVIGMVNDGDGIITIRLENDKEDEFDNIPIKKYNGLVIYLKDIANYKYQESVPTSYYRVNGLNTITLSIGIISESNLLKVAKEVSNRMFSLSENFPEDITYSLSYDSSEYISKELNKIYLRTTICILLLLLFVFLVNRSVKYMLFIALTLIINLLIAIAIYYLVGLNINIYTLAGITVSLCIIIDASIIMIDHYGYYHDRKCFPSLIAAASTTIGALLVTLILPAEERANLTDFIWVIVINLVVSLLVSWFFVPALMEYIPLSASSFSFSIRRRKKIIKYNKLYEKYINFGLEHRWIYIIIFIISFGIPLCIIPQKKVQFKEGRNETKIGALFNEFVDNVYFSRRNNIDKYLGSSFRLFYASLDRANFFRDPSRKILSIKAGMLEGCTISQLNDVVKEMENFLSQFEQIETFVTSIYSYNNANILITFKPEYENTSFPLELKSEVTAMAVNFGGANWSVYGIDENGFNNNIVSDYKSNRIQLFGYNYQELCKYAEILRSKLSENNRIKEPEIWSAGWNGRPSLEYNIQYDFEAMLAFGVNPYSYYKELYSKLYDSRIGSVYRNSEQTNVVLKSIDSEAFDLWHVLNVPINVGEEKITLSDVGNISKKRTGVSIHRVNQSYELDVCYDFVGSYQLSNAYATEIIDYMQTEILPVGYKIKSSSYLWSTTRKRQYLWLICLVIAVIYIILAISFESFRYPLSVIFMIPISFIGLFLVFGLSDFAFDQGGFAALIMLAGIVVNAGIYLITAYKHYKESPHVSSQSEVKNYIKVYNHKVYAIFLTILSTILGLIPFLSDGPNEVFWFDFAIGTISGIIFSIIALIFYLPVFALHRKKNQKIIKL